MTKDEIKCTLNPGSIMVSDTHRKYTVQINNDHVELPIHKFRKHISDKYGLTEEEYYNIVVFGDINAFPKCPCCGNTTSMMRAMFRGYNQYCSSYCRSSHRFKTENPSTKPENRKRSSDRMKKMVKDRIEKGIHGVCDPLYRDKIIQDIKRSHKERSSKGLHQFQRKDVREKISNACRERNLKLAKEGKHTFKSHLVSLNCLMARFNNDPKWKDKVFYLYLINVSEGRVKVGVTHDPSSRQYHLASDFTLCGSLHLFASGTYEEILQLEYKVKCEFCEEGREVFERKDLKSALNFIKLHRGPEIKSTDEGSNAVQSTD